MSLKTKVHLFSGFLGTGKTTALRRLLQQKSPAEQWLLIVNEFGEIGIDGAVLADNGIPVAEISGGCLCCTAGGQMGDTVRKMLAKRRPERILIEASGLAHAAGVIDELKSPEFADALEIAAVFTLVDPRQFTNPDYAANPLYKDQVGVCDVLVANKTDLCDAATLDAFRKQAAALFPPKTLVAEVQNAEIDIGSICRWRKNRATASKCCRKTPSASSRRATPSPLAAISTASGSPAFSTNCPRSPTAWCAPKAYSKCSAPGSGSTGPTANGAPTKSPGAATAASS